MQRNQQTPASNKTMASSLFLIISFLVLTNLDSVACGKSSHIRHDPFSDGCSSVEKSLATARKFFAKLDRYVARQFVLSPITIQALNDCRLLSDFNIDYLSSAHTTLNSTTDDNLSDPQSDYVHTLLSALITNQQTCVDGLNGLNLKFKDDLIVPLVNGTKLYSAACLGVERGTITKCSTKSTLCHFTTKSYG